MDHRRVRGSDSTIRGHNMGMNVNPIGISHFTISLPHKLKTKSGRL
jgi:hypothetical protein